MKNIGLALIVIGILMTAVTGFNFITREKVVDVGPVQVTTDKNNPVHWSPIVGVVILAGGVMVMAVSKNRK